MIIMAVCTVYGLDRLTLKSLLVLTLKTDLLWGTAPGILLVGRAKCKYQDIKI